MISEYSCPELDRHQKVLENDIYIEVGLISVIKPLPDTMTIPKHWFQFVTKSHLMELGEKTPYYPGIRICLSFYITQISHIITLIAFLDFVGVL